MCVFLSACRSFSNQSLLTKQLPRICRSFGLFLVKADNKVLSAFTVALFGSAVFGATD